MKNTPFWHEAAPPEDPSGAELPARCDAAIIGSGFTGLSAALTLAEAGRDVVVVESGPPGAGASTRNGGMIGWGHRVDLASLSKRYGAENARAILAEARMSLDFTTGLIERLGEDVRYRRTGRFLGASSQAKFEDLKRWAETEAPQLGMEVEVVSQERQHEHIATGLYKGGLHFRQHGGLHPALFHRALLNAARAAGVTVVDHTKVETLTGDAAAGFTLRTDRGEMAARDVIWAGNGYTGIGTFRDFASRLIPVPSTIIATEVLGANRVASLIPSGNMIVETLARHSYFRPDPWGERILWGGRASLNVLPEEESAKRLRRFMLSVFPDLEGAKLTHSWKGFVAFTFDGVPHIGRIGGVWHACGYNGSGVAMAPYLGHRLAERVISGEEGRTGFDAAPFSSPAFYRGNPWFLRGVELWYKLKDWRDTHRV